MKATTYIALTVAMMASATCSLSGVSNDCAIGDAPPLGEGAGGVIFDGGREGGVDGNGGEAPELECVCPLPINFNPECRELVQTASGQCVERPLPNFMPCRGGVGLCFGGICAAPNWGAACQQSPAGPPWVPCDNVGDCDDGNPCTSDSCPLPGCESCLHVPVADLTDCSTPDGNMVCRQGACCDKPAGTPTP